MEDWEGGPIEESGKLDNPDYRCKHGVFIGDPYGPDYMCPHCEMGTTDEDYEAIESWKRNRDKRKMWFDKKCLNAVENGKSGRWTKEETIKRMERLVSIARRYRTYARRSW